ncbi:hypothetical protein [Oceanobacillus damuensis]|uniref:hypothetical protein n=1 Tax=Oceanobacillus damuensis TaxID=937928 RepID=UPI00082A4004|nr:hypothetical protein [Oceanobacillus damuensis]
MNFYLSHSEIENLRYIIGQHERIANQLESLAYTSVKPDVREKLLSDAERAKLAQQQLLTFYN